MKRVLLGIVLLCLLWWRHQVAVTRFFDLDEFTHLHWAANMATGHKPYIDFFTIFTPGFSWFLQPLVNAFWMNPHLFIAARVVAYIIFLGILGALGVLFGTTRGWKWALLPVVILAFLPMPYDKFLEVRPDNLATLIGLVGIICQIWWIQTDKRQYALASGVAYALCLIVLVKLLPVALVGIGVASLYSFWRKRFAFDFFGGFIFPLFCVGAWFVSLGDVSQAVYSIFRMPLETNMIGKYDIMEPHLFFFPNASFYGGWGITSGLVANHLLWIVGIVMGVFRLFTPYVAGQGDKKKVLVEVLLAGIFVVLVYGYVKFFPLKHSQYLIPIAIFISYYSADALAFFFDRIKLAVVVFAVAIVMINAKVNAPKLLMTNTVQMNEIKTLVASVPLESKVLDLEGRMLFWPDAYYICCVSFGSFTHFMSRKPPSLIETLEARKVPYIFQGNSNRLASLSVEDLRYIESHYERVEGWGEAFLVRKAQR